jgi:predicted 3-demethylubiquinone-9 3-methyltransferase (glyoxalase superfamily)
MKAQKITTFLWYDGKAEEAANHYVSLFSAWSGASAASRVIHANPQFVTFELEGQQFHALNGGPKFKFTEAISLFVSCQGQQQVDELWNGFISAGGEESMCGWLKDKYGLSWQIIPVEMQQMFGDPDRARADRAMQAMLKMRKIDIAEMTRAMDG